MNYQVIVTVISVCAAWIIFSAMLVTIICMNSSRLSKIDEPFKDPAELAMRRQELRDKHGPYYPPMPEFGCWLCRDKFLAKDLIDGLCGSCFQGKCDEANESLVPDENDDPGPGHSLYQ